MMKLQMTAGIKTVARLSVFDQCRILIHLRCFAAVFASIQVWGFHCQLFAQSPDKSADRIRVAFPDAPRIVKSPAPLVQEVEAPELGTWSTPPELIRTPGEAKQISVDYPVSQTTPSTMQPSQQGASSQGQVNARDYLPVNYIPGLKPIGEIDISISPKAKQSDTTVPPKAVQLDNLAKQLDFRDASPLLANDLWLHSERESVAYQPLYFEEVNLERYGRARLGQPFLSIGRFFGTIPTIPYQMAVYDPKKPLYWNWPYRAGWGAPRVRELPPFRWNALSIEAISLTGAAALIP